MEKKCQNLNRGFWASFALFNTLLLDNIIEEAYYHTIIVIIQVLSPYMRCNLVFKKHVFGLRLLWSIKNRHYRQKN
jgi:hypothetical protein